MTKDEALKLALEAMERYQVKRQDFDWFADEITALREALANPDFWEGYVPEPVGAVGSSIKSESPLGCNGPTGPAQQEPWSPVSIGVDFTKEGAHVVGIYALDKDTSQIFYAKHHPVPQRTWVGLTKEERHEISMANRPYCADVMAAHEEELKRRNT